MDLQFVYLFNMAWALTFSALTFPGIKSCAGLVPIVHGSGFSFCWGEPIEDPCIQMLAMIKAYDPFNRPCKRHVQGQHVDAAHRCSC
jgi:hypothetical protein